MGFLLAVLPILVILFLMVGLRWGAARAGAAGYLLALGVATAFFGAGPLLLAYAHVKALLLSIDVLLIIWAAFLLYRVADEAGAIQTIGQALPHLTNDPGMQALVIGWVFASFLQGVGGFGVPVAVVAPLLVGLGFSPLVAVIIPSLGHGWAVTFGSLGSSFQALVAATGLTSGVLAPNSALFLGVSGLVVGWMVAHAAGGWTAVRRLFWPVLLLGLAMGAGQYLVAVSGMWNLAAFIGALIGLGFTFPLARKYKGPEKDNGDLNLKTLALALSGYVVLVLVILVVQFVQPIGQFLGRVVVNVDFPELRTALGFVTAAGSGRKLAIFRHTGTVLFYASFLAYLVYRKAGLYRAGSVKRIINGALQRVMSSSVGIVSMVTMAVIMEHAGMTDQLARGMAEGMNGLFPLVAPWIGALGAFMTGSNTNSNVVFGALQRHTAEILGYSAPLILAAQTAGAALASVMAPTKVVVGASTAEMAGREGEVMRKLLLYIAVLVLLISLFTMVGVWLGVERGV